MKTFSALSFSASILVGISAAIAGCGTCRTHNTAVPKTEAAEPHAQASALAIEAGADKLPTASINTAGLAALINAGVKPIILDARTGKYDDGLRIPGAKSLSPKATDKQILSVAGADKNALIVAYCSSITCPASKYLVATLKEHGYTNVLKYPEGIKAWSAAGLKVVKAK